MAGLIYGIDRLGPDRPGRRGQPERHRRRQPGHHHRRRHRRHEPVRRSRRHHRHHARRADRRTRSASGCRLAGVDEQLRDPGHRRAGHRRRLDRPVDQEGEGMTVRRSTTGEVPRPRRRPGRPEHPVLSARGLIKTFGRVDRPRRRRPRPVPRRGAGGHRRQRRRQVDADQVPDRRLIPDSRARCSSTATRSHFKSPQDAREAGIETVYQTLAVAPALDIAANLFLGREERRPGPLGSVLPDARQEGHEGRRGQVDGRTWASHDAEHGPGGGDPVRWPAPGGRRGPRRGVRPARSSCWTSRPPRWGSRRPGRCST